jgi:hypothetical protein
MLDGSSQVEFLAIAGPIYLTLCTTQCLNLIPDFLYQVPMFIITNDNDNDSEREYSRIKQELHQVSDRIRLPL